VINLTVNGISYSYPQTGDSNWGTGATGWAQAITAGTLQLAGGSFPLTSQVDFGTNFGLKALSLLTESANPSGTGYLKLSNSDSIGWRNSGNTADLVLKPDADGILQYASIDLVNLSATQTLSNKSLSGGSNTFSNIPVAALNGSVSIANGGTGQATAAAAFAALAPAGTNTYVMQYVSGAWTAAAAPATGVTSVAMTVPSFLSISGSPITTSGTLALSLASTSQGFALIGPTSGSGAPTMRALVAGDIPTLNQNTTGTAANIAGIAAIANGGTGQSNQTLAFDALSPTTTKGDLSVRGSANNVRVPVGTDGQVLVASSAATNGLNWATIQAGAKNYITYNNFENQVTTGWSTFSTTLTGLIPTGTIAAGSGALGISATLINPLGGTCSLKAVTGAALAAGQGFISQAYAIDMEDQAKVLTGKFYYNIPSGGGASNINFSGTSANSFQIYIYDTANSQWVQPAGCYGMTQGSGVGYVTFTFQTASNATSYQVAVLCVNATAGATTMLFDDFYLGPQTAPIGAVVTDWVSYTPTFTGFGTATSVAFQSRRYGDSLEINGYFVTGTVTATQAQITMGYNGSNGNVIVDTSKVNAFGYLGPMGFTGNNSTFYGGAVLAPGGSFNFMTFGIQASTTGSLVQNSGTAFISNTFIGFTATIPIVGWSSNVQMSSDTDTRVVASKYYQAANASTTANNPINFDTQVYDQTGSVTTGATTWKYIAPVTGVYQISGCLNVNTLSTSYLWKNGAQLQTLAACPVNLAVSYSTSTKLNAGDYVDIRPDTTLTTNSSSTATCSITVLRLSGPAVIAATESVNAAYDTLSSTTVTAGTALKVTVKEYDSHGVYNTSTGGYPAPSSGKYRLSLSGLISSSATPTDLNIYVNGTFRRYFGSVGPSTSFRCSISGSVSANAGDIITVVAPATSITLADTTGSFSIERVGN
jgi:hypothetical protein